MITDCKINCDTLICEICNKKAPSCNVKRNCVSIKTEDKKIEKSTILPGTELKKLLSKMGIKATGGCRCNDRAHQMDYMEQIQPGWSEKNIDVIVGWLEEEAKKRGLPFIKAFGKILVKRAIKNAQRN